MARAFPPVAEAHDERVARVITGPGSLIAGGQIFPNWGKTRRPGVSFQAVFTVAPQECRVECRQDVTTDKSSSDVTAVTMKLAAKRVPSAVVQDPQRHPVADFRPDLTPQGGPPLARREAGDAAQQGLLEFWGGRG